MFYCGRKEVMDSSVLEPDNVTGYSISIASHNDETSVSLIVTRKDEEPLELASNDNVTEEQLSAICSVLETI